MNTIYIGNIGCVYSGTDRKQANSTFREYVDQSRCEYGRAAGESVTLMKDEMPIKEYIGKLEKIARLKEFYE
jgi:hypothetical protein